MTGHHAPSAALKLAEELVGIATANAPADDYAFPSPLGEVVM